MCTTSPVVANLAELRNTVSATLPEEEQHLLLPPLGMGMGMGYEPVTGPLLLRYVPVTGPLRYPLLARYVPVTVPVTGPLPPLPLGPP